MSNQYHKILCSDPTYTKPSLRPPASRISTRSACCHACQYHYCWHGFRTSGSGGVITIPIITHHFTITYSNYHCHNRAHNQPNHPIHFRYHWYQCVCPAPIPPACTTTLVAVAVAVIMAAVAAPEGVRPPNAMVWYHPTTVLVISHRLLLANMWQQDSSHLPLSCILAAGQKGTTLALP